MKSSIKYLLFKPALWVLSYFMMTPGWTQDKGDLLVKNGTVLTVTKGVLENTDVLIKGGKIVQLGKGLQAAGTKEIDATGLFVMPGIIDAHSHIGLDAINESTNR